jgi:pimeloyl-ACP methyl ester carboxylesterase
MPNGDETHLSRRGLLSNALAASGLAMIAPLLGRPLRVFAQTPEGDTATMPATGAATPIPGAPPTTPVGDQLAWILGQLNDGAMTLTEADLANHFSPEFLAGFPFPLLDLLRETATQYAPVTVTGFPFPPTPMAAVALVDLVTGEHAAIYLTVEAAPPHCITRLDISEAPGPASATGHRIDIGDRALYLDCQGTGGPTVVLEGGISSDWAAVQPAVAESGRVCSYDRPDSPGSRSDPTPSRTAQEVVDDLRAALTAAGETGPYVMVGHSMGGLYVQLFAYLHPGEVAGLVLVDPTPEDFSARLGEMVAALGTPVPAPSMSPGPDEVSFAQMREARATRTLPSMPLIVLTHGRASDPSERPPDWPIEEEERIWFELHEEIAKIVPGGQHLVAEGSGHDIHQEQPGLVVDEIVAVVKAVREPSSWGTSVAATPAT